MKKTTAKNDGKRKMQPPVALFNGGDAGKILQPLAGEINIWERLPKALQGQLPTPEQIAALLEKA